MHRNDHSNLILVPFLETNGISTFFLLEEIYSKLDFYISK